MRRSYITLLIGVMLMSGAARQSMAQESIWAFNYNPASPLEDLQDYTNATSWRGWSFEGRRFMTGNVSLGGYIGYNGFFEEKPRSFYDINNTTINSKSWRYVYALPVLVTTHYYIGEGWIRPYIGIGVGIYYIEQKLQFSTFRTEEKNWRLGFAPEAGVFVPFGVLVNAGALLSVKYNQVFYNVQNIDTLNYLNYSLGIVFKY